MGTISDAQLCKQLSRPLDGTLARKPGRKQRYGCILGCRECWKKIELLENKAQVFTTEFHQTFVGKRIDALAQDLDFAISRIEHSRDHRQECCFSATTRADPQRQRAERPLYIDPTKSLHAGVTAAEIFLHRPAFDCNTHKSPPEDDCRLKHQDSPDAEKAGKQDDDE